MPRSVSLARPPPSHWRANPRCRTDDVFRAHEPTPDELELLTFPLAPQPSKRASDKRKKLFAAALQIRESITGQEQQLSADSAVQDASHKLPAAAAAPPPPPLTHSSPWVALLRSLPIFRDQLVHVETRAAREATCVPLYSLPLPPAIAMALEKRGIQELYEHQHASIAATLRGDNVVLSTATASGKSLAFNVPMLAKLVEDPQATFIYLFPTKALAQDQLKSLRRLLHACGLPERLAATFVRICLSLEFRMGRGIDGGLSTGRRHTHEVAVHGDPRRAHLSDEPRHAPPHDFAQAHTVEDGTGQSPVRLFPSSLIDRQGVLITTIVGCW
jgi:hypothetical protein